MFIIRKLIIKEWLTFFLGALFILCMILTLGHVITGLLKVSNELKSIFIDLVLQFPAFLIQIFPVACLIASLFSINKLKNRNELAAIFAGGFSRRDYVLTIATIATIIGLILFCVNGYLVPYTKQVQSSLADSHPSIAKKASTSSVSINALKSGRIWFKGQQYFFSYSSFDNNSNTIYDLALYYYDAQNKFSHFISAKKANYVADNQWKLLNASIVDQLSNASFPETKNQDELIVNLNENINDFKKINSDISTLSIWKLYDYILVLRANGLNSSEYLVTFLDKFSSGFTCLVLAMVASVALFNPNRRNSSFGMNVAFVLVFTFLYWFVYSYFITLGQSSKIPAVAATFGVPSLFVAYLAIYFIYHRKLR